MSASEKMGPSNPCLIIFEVLSTALEDFIHNRTERGPEKFVVLRLWAKKPGSDSRMFRKRLLRVVRTMLLGVSFEFHQS
jgi:hypothetical protein